MWMTYFTLCKVASIFTKLHLHSGYHQVGIREKIFQKEASLHPEAIFQSMPYDLAYGTHLLPFEPWWTKFFVNIFESLWLFSSMISWSSVGYGRIIWITWGSFWKRSADIIDFLLQTSSKYKCLQLWKCRALDMILLVRLPHPIGTSWKWSDTGQSLHQQLSLEARRWSGLSSCSLCKLEAHSGQK